jgi:hypothetical protein
MTADASQLVNHFAGLQLFRIRVMNTVCKIEWKIVGGVIFLTENVY